MIARKQKSAVNSTKLIDAPPAESLVPRDPPQTSRDPPRLNSSGFSRFNCARVIVGPHGALLGPTVGALATANQTRAGGLERRPARHFSGDFVHRRNARFPRMEESNRANVAWLSPGEASGDPNFREGSFLFRRAWVPDANLLVVYYQR